MSVIYFPHDEIGPQINETSVELGGSTFNVQLPRLPQVEYLGREALALYYFDHTSLEVSDKIGLGTDRSNTDNFLTRTRASYDLDGHSSRAIPQLLDRGWVDVAEVRPAPVKLSSKCIELLQVLPSGKPLPKLGEDIGVSRWAPDRLVKEGKQAFGVNTLRGLVLAGYGADIITNR